jgi:hypothetical protein
MISRNNLVPGRPRPRSHPQTNLDELRQLVLAAFADCSAAAAERLRDRARSMHSARELWLLRADIYQLVARQHCQFEAARRINALLPAFSGWLPEAALTRV